MKLRALLVLLGVALACGCVERTMVIRSDPPGAPVWVNEDYAGTTPLVHPFAFYGTSSVRVGPVRDEKDNLLYHETQVLYDAEAPWYETIPIDFLAEVLYPGTLKDVHEVPEIKLPAAKPAEAEVDEQQVQQVLQKAEQFRERALEPVPDTPSGQ